MTGNRAARRCAALALALGVIAVIQPLHAVGQDETDDAATTRTHRGFDRVVDANVRQLLDDGSGSSATTPSATRISGAATSISTRPLRARSTVAWGRA